jgi:predicted nucleotidyltransferase
MFTVEQRAALRAELLAEAAADARIAATAITGSAAEEREDRWSDIDLAFGVAGVAEMPDVMRDWTARMYERHAALHHVDVLAGDWIYRVFLVAGGLQVDLAFVPAAEFRALSPAFRLLTGVANSPSQFPAPSAGEIIGMAWLYAAHARACIARKKFLQAEYMVSGLRDHALALACLRLGLSAAHGRGFDSLPNEVKAPFEDALVRSLAEAELLRAFSVAVRGLLGEIQLADRDLAQRLRETLTELTA